MIVFFLHILIPSSQKSALAFAYFFADFSLVLLIKALLLKKRVMVLENVALHLVETNLIIRSSRFIKQSSKQAWLSDLVGHNSCVTT